MVKLQTQINYIEEVKKVRGTTIGKDGASKFTATDPLGREMELNSSRIAKYEEALQQAQTQQLTLKDDLEKEKNWKPNAKIWLSELRQPEGSWKPMKKSKTKSF